MLQDVIAVKFTATEPGHLIYLLKINKRNYHRLDCEFKTYEACNMRYKYFPYNYENEKKTFLGTFPFKKKCIDGIKIHGAHFNKKSIVSLLYLNNC